MTELHRRVDDKIVGKLMKYWPVIVSVAILCAWYGATNRDINYLKENLGIEIVKRNEHETRLSKVEQAITSIPEIQKDVKEILRRLH